MYLTGQCIITIGRLIMAGLVMNTGDLSLELKLVIVLSTSPGLMFNAANVLALSTELVVVLLAVNPG
jgi:hypothetical protein